MSRRRPLLPVLPGGRALPWVLAVAAAAVLAFGLVEGDRATIAVGAAGLLGVLIAFPLARVIVGRPPGDGDDGPGRFDS
jgi:hypothetical protein